MLMLHTREQSKNGHDLTGSMDYESAKRNCKGEYIEVEVGIKRCENDLQAISECTEHINPVHILEHSLIAYTTCQKWMFWRISVQKALYVRMLGTIKEWFRCNQSMDYEYDVQSALSYHLRLNSKAYRALYTGFAFARIPLSPILFLLC
ncbi:hypothetical protein V6N13_127635 [Hibiscus sabdariffa]|uniref:Uncharacterized protein n=1 Tax=Hibiscus sabdariffa TaxID=183260 RepID=A0ABR2CD82_9ROSI